MNLSADVKEDAERHSVTEYPREACGLVVIFKGRQQYHACRNIAEGTDQFAIHPEDYADADAKGEIVAVVHSHPNLPPVPSQADLVSCEQTGLAWFIIGVPTLTWGELYPQGYIAPLVGRQWSHGVLDCYSIIRDWYKQERDIDLLDFERRDEWWLRGGNLYAENFEKAGFRDVPVNDLQAGDVILMQVGSPVPNHGAIYLGDGLILHHIQNRLSTRDVYGGFWQKNTSRVVRYGSCPAVG